MIEEGGGFSREGHQGAEFKTPTFVFSTRALKDRDGCQNSGITFSQGFLLLFVCFFLLKKLLQKDAKNGGHHFKYP